jgi:hypothetical protein
MHTHRHFVPTLARPLGALRFTGSSSQWLEPSAPEVVSPPSSPFVQEWIEAGRAHEPQSPKHPGLAER